MLILHNSLVIKIYINILFSISDFSLFSSYHFFILHFFTIRLILGLYCLFFIPFFYKFYYFILIYCIYFFLVYILFYFILYLILLNILLHLLNKFKKSKNFINYMIRNIILYKNKLILIFKKQVKNLIILNKNYFIKSSKFCLKTLNC